MGDVNEYAQWIINNQDKQGTKEYNTVVEGYKILRARQVASPPAMAQQQPMPQERPSIFQRISSAINPPKENFPEFMGGGSPEDALAYARQMGDTTASLGTDIYGNPTITTAGRGQQYINRPGLSVNDISGAIRGVERTAQEVAPYLAGGVVTAPLKAGFQTLAQGGIGLAQESIQQAVRAAQGDSVEWSRLATTPIFAMVGDAVGRLAYSVAAPAISKILGSRPTFRIVNPDGTLTDDAVKMLREAGATTDEVSRAMAEETNALKRTGVLTEAQAERFNFMKGMGIEPTAAQITRTASDFQTQQELAKRSGEVRSALEGQEAVIARAFDDRVIGTGGATTGSPISDAVVRKATDLDSQISSFYKAAREAAPGAQNVRLNRYAETLRRRAPDNELTGGLIRSIRGDLMERGIIDKNFKVVGLVDVDTAETVRQVLNQRYDSTNAFGKKIIRELKEQLDDDVISTAGNDIFRQARAAREDFSAQLRPDKVSKFDINERSFIEDIMDNTIKADDVFDKLILSAQAKPSDLVQLKRYLTTGSSEQIEQGARALNSLRAQTLDWIKSTAFTGPLDENGFQAVTRAGLDRALDKIGAEKLSLIFTQNEVKFLNDMRKLAALREPVRGTALGRGPSAQAIEQLERSIVSRIPVVGQFYDFFKNLGIIRADKLATSQTLNPASATMQALTRAANTSATARQVSGATRGVSAYTGAQAQEQQ